MGAAEQGSLVCVPACLRAYVAVWLCGRAVVHAPRCAALGCAALRRGRGVGWLVTVTPSHFAAPLLSLFDSTRPDPTRLFSSHVNLATSRSDQKQKPFALCGSVCVVCGLELALELEMRPFPLSGRLVPRLE